MKQIKSYGCVLMLAALATLAAAPEARAQVPGAVTLKGSGTRRFVGSLRWQATSKSIQVTDAKNISTTHPLTEIASIQAVRPRELDQAIRAVKDKNGAVAIAALTKIATDYFMLQHDEEATLWLAEAYLQTGNSAEAVRAVEKITSTRPEAAYLGEMATVYWRALLRENRAAKLDDLLEQAIKSGNRMASASALILRGDLILKGGDTQDHHTRALKDGYLRVVTLYRSVRTVQPEANYKAAKSLEKLGMTSRAQARREVIRKEFPGSEWANKP